MRSLLLLTFTVLTNVCFSQAGKEDPKLRITGPGYKIQYPASWRVDSTRNMGTELIFYSPFDNEADKFSESVNFMIQNLKGRNIDLQKYKEITDQELAALGGDSKILESSIQKTSVGDCFRFMYEMTLDNRKLRFTAICYVKNETAYLLTFTSTVNNYERYKNAGEDMLRSFVLTK